MSTLLSAISGQFTKALIMGALFPSLLFMCLLLIAATSLIPSAPALLDLIGSPTAWEVIAFTFATLVVAGVIYNLNIPIIRLYEGYPWRFSFLGSVRTKYYQKKLEQYSKTCRCLRNLRNEFNRRGVNYGQLPELIRYLDRFDHERVNAFPDSALVLPTRLGNVIRSFENYPRKQYGIDGVRVWTRITSMAAKEDLVAVDDGKIGLDFFLNCSLLSGLMALLLLILGLVFRVPFRETWTVFVWLTAMLAGLLGWLLAYEASIGQASTWGDQVKSIFDLYRWRLLQQMGYKQSPTTRAQERALWIAISRQIIYGDPPIGDPHPYDAPSCSFE